MAKKDNKNDIKEEFISLNEGIPKKNPLLSLNDITEIRDIDLRTIKSYCKKLNINIVNGSIPVGSLIDLLIQNAKTYDGRRAKGKFKIDIEDELPDEIKKELQSYENDIFAPRGQIHQTDPILFKAFWDSFKSWLLAQVQANRYIPVADVKESIYKIISKFKDYFVTLQDKVDVSFPNNPEVQAVASVWISETLLEIYDDLLNAIDDFKLESENSTKLESEKKDIIEKSENLYGRYLKDKQALDDKDVEDLKAKLELDLDNSNIEEPHLEDIDSQKICENEMKKLHISNN